MEKFAVLRYAQSRAELINDKRYNFFCKFKNMKRADKIMRNYICEKFPMVAKQCEIFGAEGYEVALPITAEDAGSMPDFRDYVYTTALSMLKESRVNAVIPIAGETYTYDHIIIAPSGFYILPFLLPSVIKKLCKMIEKDVSKAEIAVIDGDADLTCDILCILSKEVNYFSLYTQNTTCFTNVCQNIYDDTGQVIGLINESNVSLIESADIILNASTDLDRLIGKFKNKSILFDMAGDSTATRSLSAKRADMFCFDGVSFKFNEGFIDNKTLETVVFSRKESFRKYIEGKFTDEDFYDILDYVNVPSLKASSFTLLGKSLHT